MSRDELPQLAGDSLEGFEVWDRNVRAPVHQAAKAAFVSIRVGGNIGVNRAALKMWGEPEACQVMFDPERQRIALKPCSPEEPNSYEINCSSAPTQIPARSMFDFYGVEIKKTRRYHDPKVIDGVLVVDL